MVLHYWLITNNNLNILDVCVCVIIIFTNNQNDIRFYVITNKIYLTYPEDWQSVRNQWRKRQSDRKSWTNPSCRFFRTGNLCPPQNADQSNLTGNLTPFIDGKKGKISNLSESPVACPLNKYYCGFCLIGWKSKTIHLIRVPLHKSVRLKLSL